MSDATTPQVAGPRTPCLRTGRHLGRTLYMQVGAEPSARDIFLGIFDSAEIAALIASEINRSQWMLHQIGIQLHAVTE